VSAGGAVAVAVGCAVPPVPLVPVLPVEPELPVEPVLPVEPLLPLVPDEVVPEPDAGVGVGVGVAVELASASSPAALLGAVSPETSRFGIGSVGGDAFVST